MIKKLYRFLNPQFQTLFLEYKVKFEPRYGHGKPPHGELYRLINQGREGYADQLVRMTAYKEKIWTIKDAEKETDTTYPTWNNGFLPGLDIVALYGMIAEKKPSLYIEIGSGNSTKVAFKAKTEQSPHTRIISIDPQPRAEIDILADEVIRQPFESIIWNDLPELNEGDLLFVDNSHRILPNSDAMVFFMEVLPTLKKGVIVQIHDVYLPYDYPTFMCQRGYSEQYGLAMNIMANPQRYKPLLPNYFIYEDAELSDLLRPIWANENLPLIEKHGGSFWLSIEQ